VRCYAQRNACCEDDIAAATEISDGGDVRWQPMYGSVTVVLLDVLLDPLCTTPAT
jgi:hypothetical protein